MRNDAVTRKPSSLTNKGGTGERASRRCLSGALATCLFIAAMATHVPAVLAQNVSVAPTRVVFEGRIRSAQVALINQGTAPVTYRISFTQRRMTEDGGFEEITTPGPADAFADPLIRYSPRQVTLEPGVGQTVRLLLRKPAGLEPGEYRSHLLLRAVPPEDAGTSIESIGDQEVGVNLKPIYGALIPVIVRHGDLSAGVTLSDLAFEADEKPTVSFRFERSGGRSVYGDVTVSWIPAGSGSETVVQLVKGIAVYTPNPSRTVRLALHPPDGVDLRDGRLKVTFAERPEAGGAVQAEAEIPLS